ncbi:hypothetical protein VTN02DRAFT_175 [Thermoascus thermophilus]
MSQRTRRAERTGSRGFNNPTVPMAFQLQRLRIAPQAESGALGDIVEARQRPEAISDLPCIEPCSGGSFSFEP